MLIASAAYRGCSPADFRLQQIADFICEIELAAIKYEANEVGKTEKISFSTNRDFKKNYLKGLRKKRLGSRQGRTSPCAGLGVRPSHWTVLQLLKPQAAHRFASLHNYARRLFRSP